MLLERPRARALRQLRASIADGSFAQGQPLPPERDLAEAYKVSRNTLRWALERLTQEGLVQSGGTRTRLVSKQGSRHTVMTSAVYLYGAVEVEKTWNLSTGWGSMVPDAAMKGLSAGGYTVVKPSRASPDDRDMEAFARTPPLGVLLTYEATFGASGEGALRAATLAAAKVPTVMFGDEPASCDRVNSDQEAGAFMLTSWLIARGRRRPLCLWPAKEHATWAVSRRAGYERAMRAHGLVPLPTEIAYWPKEVTELAPFRDHALRLAGHLAPHLLSSTPVDAVMAISDGDVPCISAAIRHCGREPNKDVDIVGYDAYWMDIPERAHCPDPPAATVDKDNRAIGLAMVQLLTERLAGTLPAEPQKRLITPRLITEFAV